MNRIRITIQKGLISSKLCLVPVNTSVVTGKITAKLCVPHWNNKHRSLYKHVEQSFDYSKVGK